MFFRSIFCFCSLVSVLCFFVRVKSFRKKKEKKFKTALMTSFTLLLVTSDLLQRATSATSNERILQRVTSDFTTSNEQRVKSYASLKTIIIIIISFILIRKFYFLSHKNFCFSKMSLCHDVLKNQKLLQ